MARFEKGNDGAGGKVRLAPSALGALAPFIEAARIQTAKGLEAPPRRWIIYLTVAHVTGAGAVVPGPSTQDVSVSLRLRVRFGTWQGQHVMDLMPHGVGQSISVAGQNVIVEVQNRDATVTYEVTATIAPAEPQSELATSDATVGASTTGDIVIPPFAVAARFAGFDANVTATFLHVGGGVISEAIDTTTGLFYAIPRAAVTLRLTNGNASPRTGAVQFEVMR